MLANEHRMLLSEVPAINRFSPEEVAVEEPMTLPFNPLFREPEHWDGDGDQQHYTENTCHNLARLRLRELNITSAARANNAWR